MNHLHMKNHLSFNFKDGNERSEDIQEYEQFYLLHDGIYMTGAADVSFILGCLCLHDI